MVRVDGDLDAEDGQVVITALRAEMDASARDDGADERTPPQRRADALVEICRRYLDSGDRPTVAGERPHIVVTLDLESLEGRAGRCCELDDAGVISPGAARRIACDASVSRVIITGRSEPLDVGRRTPVVLHWADGGETSLANLALLCRPHHGLVRDVFRMEVTGSGLQFFRPDGTLIEDRAPP